MCGQPNTVILFEQERPPKGCLSTLQQNLNRGNPGLDCNVKFVPNHVINSSVPLNEIVNSKGSQELFGMGTFQGRHSYLH